MKILWKRGEIAPKEQFLLFSTIFCRLLVDLCIKRGTRFSLRDKRLFEINEVEITSRLYYILLPADVFKHCAGLVAISVDPDQTPQNAASDLGLHCLLRLSCPNTWGYYGYL